jgi:ZIP family zinc transporter
MAIIVSLFAFAFTLLGGFFALRLGRGLALVLGFSAGAVIGVALFDLAPEAMELAGDRMGAAAVTAMTGLGFAFYLVLHRAAATSGRAGGLGAATLTIHSFLDGLSIGVAFKVSAAVGTVVAIAVVVHDLCDGINTVSVVRRNGGDAGAAWRWLVADATAPVVGATAALAVHLDDGQLGLALALFSGFFLYIGASDLLPATLQPGRAMAPTVMTLLGMMVLYAAVRLAAL